MGIIFQQELYRNQSNDSQYKATTWFLCKHVPTKKNFRKDFI